MQVVKQATKWSLAEVKSTFCNLFVANQLTPDNSNLPQTRSKFNFPSGHFLTNFTLDNSNSQQLERFPISLEGSSCREWTIGELCATSSCNL